MTRHMAYEHVRVDYGHNWMIYLVVAATNLSASRNRTQLEWRKPLTMTHLHLNEVDFDIFHLCEISNEAWTWIDPRDSFISTRADIGRAPAAQTDRHMRVFAHSPVHFGAYVLLGIHLARIHYFFLSIGSPHTME